MPAPVNVTLALCKFPEKSISPSTFIVPVVALTSETFPPTLPVIIKEHAFRIPALTSRYGLPELDTIVIRPETVIVPLLCLTLPLAAPLPPPVIESEAHESVPAATSINDADAFDVTVTEPAT